MRDISGLIVLPHLRVQNANAISGPLSWGFPSPTAFTGFVHALERQFAAQLPEGKQSRFICKYSRLWFLSARKMQLR